MRAGDEETAERQGPNPDLEGQGGFLEEESSNGVSGNEEGLARRRWKGSQAKGNIPTEGPEEKGWRGASRDTSMPGGGGQGWV